MKYCITNNGHWDAEYVLHPMTVCVVQAIAPRTVQNAVNYTHVGLFFNQGQCCCAGSRVYVQAGVYDKFVEMMTAKVNQTIVGDPFDMKSEQGPQVGL